jgi:hypothetical protein
VVLGRALAGWLVVLGSGADSWLVLLGVWAAGWLVAAVFACMAQCVFYLSVTNLMIMLRHIRLGMGGSIQPLTREIV